MNITKQIKIFYYIQSYLRLFLKHLIAAYISLKNSKTLKVLRPITSILTNIPDTSQKMSL